MIHVQSLCVVNHRSSCKINSSKILINTVFIVWSSDPYASLLIEMIRRLIIRNDKMVLVRTLEIYTSLLEQTIVEENPLIDNVKQSQLAEFLAEKVSIFH